MLVFICDLCSYTNKVIYKFVICIFVDVIKMNKLKNYFLISKLKKSISQICRGHCIFREIIFSMNNESGFKYA